MSAMTNGGKFLWAFCTPTVTISESRLPGNDFQQETVIESLLGRTNPPDMEIRQIAWKGRGVFVNEKLPAGMYIAEYKTTKVYERAKRKENEDMYKR